MAAYEDPHESLKKLQASLGLGSAALPFSGEPSETLPFFPGGDVLADPFPKFESTPLTQRQRSATQGALRTSDRIAAELYSAGKLPEARKAVEEAGEKGWLSTATDPIFDLLQMFNSVSAGLVDEWIKTGNFGDAIEQAGVEFANALPGIELSQARRPGWSDVLKNSDVFNEDATGRYSAATLGFLMDVFLDPLTYTGLGIAKSARLLREAGGVARGLDVLARQRIPGAQIFGEAFLKDFKIKQFALRGTAEDKAAAANFFEAVKARHAQKEEGFLELEEVAGTLRDGLTKDTSTLLQLFMDQGDDILRPILQKNLQDKGQEHLLPAVMEKVKQFRGFFKKEAELNSEAGVLAKDAVRGLGNFAPGRVPLTRDSERAWRKLIEEINVNELLPLAEISKLDPELAARLAQVGNIQEIGAFAHAKTYDNIIDRVLAGHPTELDIGQSALQLGMEGVRARSTRNLLNAVFTDGSIAKKIEQSSDGARLLMDDAKIQDLLRRGYRIIDPVELKSYAKKEERILGEEGLWNKLVDDKPGIWAVPEPIFEDLVRSNSFFKEGSVAAEFFDNFRKIQGIWKGYALLSPGFHMRNQYSNVFQNFVAKVSDPRRYAMAAGLQAGGTGNLPRGVRGVVEAMIGKKSMDDVWITHKDRTWTGLELQTAMKNQSVMNNGLFTKDFGIDIEREMLTNMERGIRKNSLGRLTKQGLKKKAQLLDGGSEEAEADLLARLYDSRARTWAIHNGKTVDDFDRAHEVVVARGLADDFVPGEHVFYQGGEKFQMKGPADGPDVMWGELEQEWYEGFQKGTVDPTTGYINPTAAELRKMPGAPSTTPQELRDGFLRGIEKRQAKEREAGEAVFEGEVRPWSWDFRDMEKALDKAIDEGGDSPFWYKSFGEGASRLVGEKNMPEFAGVFALLSPQKAVEDNLSEALWVMRMARESFTGKNNAFSPSAFREKMYGNRTVLKVKTPDTLSRTGRDAAQYIEVEKGLFFPKGEGTKATGVAKLVNLYEKATFTGDLKTISFDLNLLQQAAGGFFPGTVNDRHIARLFGVTIPLTKKIHHNSEGIVVTKARYDKLPVAQRGEITTLSTREFAFPTHRNAATYRFVQYQIAELARRKNMAPDEAQAALWWYAKKYLSPKAADSATAHVGGDAWKHEIGSFPSALAYSKPEVDKLSKVLDRDTALPGFEAVATKYPVETFGKNPYKISERFALSRGERIVTVPSKIGGLAVGSEAAGTGQQLAFHHKVFDRITTTDGKKIKALADLEDTLGFTHEVHRDALGSGWGIENDISITIRARDDDVAAGIAGIVGDSMNMKNASWYRAQRMTEAQAEMLSKERPGLETGFGLRLSKNDESAFEPDELKKFLAIGFKTEPGNKAIRVFDQKGDRARSWRGNQEKLIARVDKAIGKGDIRKEFYTYAGETYAEREFGTAIAKIRMGASTGGPSDLPGRIYSELHRHYRETFNEWNQRHGWGLDDLPVGRSSRALDEAFAGAPPINRVGDPSFQRGGAGGNVKGAIQFAEDGRSMINLFENADVSTIIHELGHFFRRSDIDPDDLAIFEKWAKVKDGKWGVQAEEKFSRALEQYMREGVAPTRDLQEVMAKTTDWMEDIYEVMVGSPINRKLNDETRAAFDRMFGLGITEPLGSRAAEVAQKAVDLRPTRDTLGEKIEGAGEYLSRWFGHSAPLMRWNRAMGRMFENNARGAHFIDKLEKTGDEVTSGNSVMKYLFDYDNGLTPFEDTVMRSVAPFYTWMRFNIPLQMQAIFEDPGRYAIIPKFMDAVEGITSDWRDIPTPDYYEELHAVRLPIIMGGKPTYINPNLPFQDLNRLNYKDMASSLTPFVKLAGEWLPERGYSTFLDRPIEKYPGEPSKVLPWLDKTTEHALMTLVPTFGKAQRMIKAGKRDELPAQLLSELAGIKLMNVDKERVLRGQAYALREALTGIKQKLEAEGEIPKRLRRVAPSKRRRRRKRRGRRSRARAQPPAGQIARQLLG